MNDIQLITYAAISFVGIAVSALIGYFIGKIYARPIHHVVEVKEIVREPSELIELKRDLIIDEYELSRMKPPSKNHIEYMVMKTIHCMVEDAPKEVFEVIEHPQDFRSLGSQKRYTITIKIFPPKSFKNDPTTINTPNP